MWKIVEITNLTSPEQRVFVSGGEALFNVVRGPEGSSYRIIVENRGFLDLVDTGRGAGGWGISLNGCLFCYEGSGEVHLTINNDRTFQATGNKGLVLTGKLKPLPAVSRRDTFLLQEMMELKLVPYQNIPDSPGKSPEALEMLSKLYFPFTEHKKELTYSVYDWTSPSFMRMVLFKFFSFTDIVDAPLSQSAIANVIWTSNWPPFTPRDKDYMNSFLMKPAESEENVCLQLSLLHKRLHAYCEAQNNLIRDAFYSLPRTSVYKVPQLFSGQPSIGNLGLDRFAAEFYEFPGNAGQLGMAMEMPFHRALETLFKVGNTITTKGIVSFTEHRDYAMKYCNGVLLVLKPAPGAVIWEVPTYITHLSDDPEKNEYSLPPKCKFLIKKVEKEAISEKEVWVFTLMITS